MQEPYMIYIVYIPNQLILGLASFLNGMQTNEAMQKTSIYICDI